jgi:hypothetical protein
MDTFQDTKLPAIKKHCVGNQSIIVAARNLYTAVATTAYSAIIAIKNSEILNAGNNAVLNYSGLSALCATSVHCLSALLL